MSIVEPGPGTFLIASPGLLDPNFRRSVVLLCDHGPESSMGLVVNRPMQVSAAKFLPQLENLPARDSTLVHCGGPVETHRLLVLRHGPTDGELFHEVLSNVSLVSDIDTALGDESERQSAIPDYRFFLGYAGWGERQLAQELEEQAWIVRSASASLIFDTPPAQMWSEALRELGGIYQLYAEMPIDPSMN